MTEFIMLDISFQDFVFYLFLIPLSSVVGMFWTTRILYVRMLIRDIYACCFYQCLGFGTKKGKNGEKDKEVPIFKVKTNVVYLGLTFISHRKARKANNDS